FRGFASPSRFRPELRDVRNDSSSYCRLCLLWFERRDVFRHVGGVLENVVRKDHYSESALVAGRDLQGAGISEMEIDFQNVVDERRIEELGNFELRDIAQPRDVVALRRLNGNNL